jgi:hypothetical protein
MSVCLCPLQQNKRVGGERKKKKIVFSKQNVCLVSSSEHKREQSFSATTSQKKIQNQTMGVGFFLSSLRKFV